MKLIGLGLGILVLSQIACSTDDVGAPANAGAGGIGGFAIQTAGTSGHGGVTGAGAEAVAGASLGGAPAAGFGGNDWGGSAGATVGGSPGAAGSAGAAGTAGTAGMGPVAHRFVSGISGDGPVAIVGADGHIEWQHHVAGEANDVWALPNGHVVFAYKTGATELDANQQAIWSYDAPPGAEIQGCQPLAGGGFLIGEAHDGGMSFLRELDAAGKMNKSVSVNAGANLSAHEQFREVRKTPQGSYLVTYIGLGRAREVDAAGKVLREFPCGSFVAVRLPDGNTLIPCGDDHSVIEVDPQNKVVWQVDQMEIPGNQLGFAAGVQRLSNGNTIICNWSGHGGVPPDQPQCFELTRDKHVVWELKHPELAKISNLEVLDPDASVDGAVLR
jgi:hypothetical protein